MKSKLLKRISNVTFMLFSLISTAQTTYYVDVNKTDNTGLGTSWSTAKKDLQIAINAAVLGDEIWVKAGTYLPTHDPFGNTTPADNRDKTFLLKNGVKIYGGFAGTETLLSQRNSQTNVTILSGDLGTINTLTDNAYHVVLSINLTASSLLDGVTITKGYATAPGGSTITVATLIIERFKGGGIYNAFSATAFTNCTIKSNSADCTNTDDDSWGAGIVNDRCSSSFTNCIIDSNSFLVGGGSFGVFGAGMLINGGNCSIDSCIFSNNTSGSGFLDASRGGALNINGTAIIVNSVFYNNSAQNGAALQFGGAEGNTTTVTNCSFVNNTSSFAGTAYQGFSKATFKNCLFWDTTPTSSSIPGRNEIYSQDNRVGFQPTFQNCSIKDATGSPLAITNTVLVNCLNTNPLFVNAADGDGADNRWATTDDGLSIQSTSPVKNFGTTGADIPSTDIIGITRDAQPDLGAYEYVAPCINPTAYTVNGGGAYCAGGVGQVVLLLGSETGVTYQLKNNGVNIGSPITGTGNAISFGNQTVAGTYTVIATKTSGGCTTTMTGSVTITITPNVTPTFTPVIPICSGSSLSALPATSNNSITGMWSPVLNNTQTTTYTFTPSSGQCATTATLTITINPNETPTFTAVSPICSGATLSALPTTSNNAIIGTWSPPLDNTRTATYTFTPGAGQCATTATLTITVNPNVTPTFIQAPPICSGEILLDLPTTSINDITGTWNPSLDNIHTTTYTFTPVGGQCATNAELTITVNPNLTPTFTQVAPICLGETLLDLPTISNNGISGSWTPNIDNAQTTTYTFTPLSEQCAVESTMTITVNVTNAPTGIAIQDACLTGTLNDLQVSGNAITWYSTPSGNEVLPLNTNLVNGSVYYASQTVSGCESLDRLAVTSSGPCLNIDNYSDVKINYLPNPVENVLTISSNEIITTYHLINSIGQLLATEKVNMTDFEIDMSALPSGSYLIKLSSDRKFKTLKIVKH